MNVLLLIDIATRVALLLLEAAVPLGIMSALVGKLFQNLGTLDMRMAERQAAKRYADLARKHPETAKIVDELFEPKLAVHSGK